MGRPVKWCKQNIDSAEFTDWIAYFNKHPFGEDRMDLRFAVLCALIAGVNTPKGKPAPKPDKFMLDNLLNGKKDQTVEQMQDVMMAFASKHNMKVERDEA